MILDGLGLRRFWPHEPGCYTEDDFWVDPCLGLAAVARGSGAIGGQGKPAGKLAVWSLAGEIGAPPRRLGASSSAEARLRGGFARAGVAVERLSASWTPGLGRPSATMAALLLDGVTAIVAQIGDCRVSRLGRDGLEPLTRAHTVGADWPAEQPPLPPEIMRVPSRGLGIGGEPEIRRIPVQLGDVFLLTTRDVDDTLSPVELTSVLRRMASPSGDMSAVLDEIVHRVELRRSDFGRATLAVAKVGVGAGRPASRASSEAPGLRWLFAPGEPLEDPPPEHAPGTAGPDQTWISEVFWPVMGKD